MRPKSADDEGAADGEGHPGNGADSQGETHRQLGRAKILEEPEEVGLKEAPHRATDEEDDKKHEDVRLQDQLPEVLEHFLSRLLETGKIKLISESFRIFAHLRLSFRMRRAHMRRIPKKVQNTGA